MAFLQQGAPSAAMWDMADNPLRGSACVFTDLETHILKFGNTRKKAAAGRSGLVSGKKKMESMQ